MNLGVAAGHDREPDVAGPAAPHEVGAAGRVGPDHRSGRRTDGRVVAGSVTERRSRRAAGRSRVEHGEMIGDVVRAGVARPQPHGQRLAGRVREAEHRMEPEPALVVRGRALPCSPSGSRSTTRRCPTRSVSYPSSPTTGATPGARRCGHRVPQAGERHRVDADGTCDTTSSPTAPTRTGRLRTEMLDVRARLAATGEHQHRLDQHLSPVMDREPFTRWHAIRADSESPKPSRSANRPSACNPTCATTCSPPASTPTATVLLPFTCQVPFLVGVSLLRNIKNALREGLLSRWATRNPVRPVNDRG